MAVTTPYQILDEEGKAHGEVPDLSPEQLVAFHRWMLLGRTFSDKMVALQRQGRMGTFGSLAGQEAASVAMGFALQPQDWLGTSYREIITMMIKGVPMLAVMRLYQGQVGDLYPAEARTLPLQIVLATQALHVAGLAMAAKIRGDKAVAMSICGDGATSEGDFHEALNFAGVFRAPAVFCVQNNGWAISVPRRRQTAAETIAQKAVAFGFPGVQVDGNDVLASFKVVRDAVERARAGEGPTLVELITYRMGAHTTADDPKRYVPADELERWRAKDPIKRYRRFLFDRNLLTEAEEARLQEAVQAEVNRTVETLESMAPTPPERIFGLVYEQMTPQQRAQQAELRQFLKEVR